MRKSLNLRDLFRPHINARSFLVSDIPKSHALVYTFWTCATAGKETAKACFRSYRYFKKPRFNIRTTYVTRGMRLVDTTKDHVHVLKKNTLHLQVKGKNWLRTVLLQLILNACKRGLCYIYFYRQTCYTRVNSMSFTKLSMFSKHGMIGSCLPSCSYIFRIFNSKALDM